MWMNIAALKNSEFDYVLKDIQAVRNVVPKGHNLKVIIEPCTLTPEQIETAVKLVVEGGADFVKAGTGFWEHVHWNMPDSCSEQQMVM